MAFHYTPILISALLLSRKPTSQNTCNVCISLRCPTGSRTALRFLGLCCLMTPGLSKDIRCHVWPCFFYTCKSPDQTSGHTSWAVSLVIAHGHFILPQGLRFVWVCMSFIALSLYHPWRLGGFLDVVYYAMPSYFHMNKLYLNQQQTVLWILLKQSSYTTILWSVLYIKHITTCYVTKLEF